MCIIIIHVYPCTQVHAYTHSDPSHMLPNAMPDLGDVQVTIMSVMFLQLAVHSWGVLGAVQESFS